MAITEILSNGQMEIRFSEKLLGLEFWETKGLNLTVLNGVKNKLMKVNYYCLIEIDDKTTKPELVDWLILEFNSYRMVIKMNFSDPIYVSSSADLKDLIGIDILNYKLFIASKDMTVLAENYTVANSTIPSQAKSEKDYKLISNVGSSVENSMLITLLVPFCFMLFMSVSMEKVWSFYLMLQVVSNILNYQSLVIPANAQYLLFICDTISNF
jgi:hypothetical protein